MLLHERLRERQPQTRPAIATRYQRVEDAIAKGLGNARTVVLHMQFQCQSEALLADRDLARDARAQHDARIARQDALGQRLRRVVHDVEHGLDELLAVAAEFGDRRVVVALHLQPTRVLGLHERAHAFADLVDVAVAHHVRVAVRREQAVNQRLQTIGLVDDDVGVLGELARIDFHREQLRRAADPAERGS